MRMLLVTVRGTFLAHKRLLRSPKLCLRCISTLRVDPSIREFTSSLTQTLPVFSIPPANISILSKPSQFYALLLDMIRRAESRIFISSLYIGPAESELIKALEETLRNKPSLQLYLHLDLNRSTRPGASSTAKILLPLLRAFSSRVHISLFRSPSLRGILAKIVPPRFNEGWGTWHAKIYGVDDEVMISGANLNNSYFTNRQDRYIHFKAQPVLAQYCFDFLQTVSTFSYKLLLPTSPISSTNIHSYRHDGYTLHWPDPHTHPHYIHQKAEAALTTFQALYRDACRQEPQLTTSASAASTSVDSHTAGTNDVLLFPVIQAGQFNIREEEMTLALLFRHLNSRPANESNLRPHSRPLLDLTSGYFGLYQPYQDLVIASANVETRIIAASPKANGFYGSSGISGRIPEGYTLLEQRFMSSVQVAGRLCKSSSESGDKRGIQLNEWEKEGWTYHAKGIWVSPSSSSPPVLTLFGSTNLNSRSAHIDTELSFLMVVPSNQGSDRQKPDNPPITESRPHASGGEDLSPYTSLSLRSRLAAEIDDLRSHAVEWKGEQRRVRFWTKMIVKLVHGML